AVGVGRGASGQVGAQHRLGDPTCLGQKAEGVGRGQRVRIERRLFVVHVFFPLPSRARSRPPYPAPSGTSGTPGIPAGINWLTFRAGGNRCRYASASADALTSNPRRENDHAEEECEGRREGSDG